jgi:hypothetical protein
MQKMGILIMTHRHSALPLMENLFLEIPTRFRILSLGIIFDHHALRVQ